MTNKNVVLGVDVGVASLGVCVAAVDAAGQPCEFLYGNSFIYPVPDGAADRRRHRAMRRGYGRKRERLAELRALLSGKLGLQPDFDGKPDGQKDPRPTDAAFEPHQLRDAKERLLVSPNSRTRLRALGLTQCLTPEDLARAVMHIARNRGMRLTRVLGTGKEEAEARKEASAMAEEAGRTERKMKAQGASTPGQLLWSYEQKAAAAHQRPALRRRAGTELRLQFVRKQVVEELDGILRQQAKYHPVLSPELRETISEMVFREEEPPKPEVGRCLYFPETEARLPLACDLFQQKRIYEEVNNLRIEYANASKDGLDESQRNAVAERLLSGEDLSMAQIKKIIGATERGLRISLEGKAGRNAGPTRPLKGHALRAAFRSADAAYQQLTGHTGRLGTLYDQLDGTERDAFERLFREEDDRAEVIAALTSEYGLDSDEAANAADAVALPRGYAKTGPTATAKLLKVLKAQIIDNTNAAKKAGLEPATGRELEFTRLPYYGIVFPHLVRGRMNPEDRGYPAADNETRYGRIPNPVVHVALNAIRKVVNPLLKRGEKEGWRFVGVNIELAREMKKTQDDRDKDTRRIARERKRNEDYDAITLKHNKPASRKNRRKLRLWEAQGKICPYTGLSINVEDLFSGKFDIDHILPRSETLDDSMRNLLVTHEAANKRKGNDSPYEAFSGGLKVGSSDRSYEQIVETVRRTKGIAHKEKLFRPDAMDRFKDRNAFAQRFKTDTSYIAKTAAQYLMCVFPHLRGSDRRSGGVVALNGSITDELRKIWGVMDLVQEVAHSQDPELVEAPPTREERERGEKRGKSREDHRHHLLDAAIAACTPRSEVTLLQTLSARGESRASEKHREQKPPWPSFREDLGNLLSKTQVAHRPNREINGKLHDATSLGIVARFADGRYLTRSRKRFDTTSFQKPEDVGAKLRVDPAHIEHLERELAEGTVQLFWKSADPVGDLRRHAAELEETASEIGALYARQPTEEQYEDIDRKTGAIELRTRKCTEIQRLAYAFQEYRQRRKAAGLPPRRTVRLYGLDEAVIVQGSSENGTQPRRSYRPGSNAWLDIFRRPDGRSDFEVVRTIDAMHPEIQPQWQREEGNDLLLRLFRGDTVRMRTKDGKSRLCVLIKISPGDWEFQPVNLASHISQHPARKNFRFGFRAMIEAGPQLVVRDPAGRIVWESPRLNW